MTYKPSKLGQTDLTFWLVISLSVVLHAGLQSFMCNSYAIVMICATLVNTQTDTDIQTHLQTAFGQLYH